MFQPILRALKAFKILALLVLCCVLGYSQEMKQLPNSQEGVINSIVNWGEKLNSKGAKAELREVKRSEKDSKTHACL